MGSSNRDYMQDGYETRQRSWGDDTPTTKWLLIITGIVFVLQLFLTHDVEVAAPGDSSVAQAGDTVITVGRHLAEPTQRRRLFYNIPYIDEWFALDAQKVLHGQVWRLVTYVFCHSNPISLVFNMLVLWFFGSVLERMYGSRELLWFYLTSAVVCGLVFVAFGLKLYLPTPQMGAGPCVMALFCLYATHFPFQEILVFWVIPMQIRVALMIYIFFDLYNIVSASKGRMGWETVAYTAEIWAIAFAYLYRRLNWRLSEFQNMLDVGRMRRSIRRAGTARTLKVFHPEPATNLEEQVDAILAKIHEQGSESLTERERAILQKASEQAKNRL